jgi:hypothetical protein
VRLPAPALERHGRLTVVRDDLLEGGSKTRFLPYLVGGAREVVFGGPFCGGAPVALAVIGRRLGIRVTLFYAKRRELHPRQAAAAALGAQLFLVPFGYMTNVQAKARAYAQEVGALFLPLGFDVPAAEEPFVADMEAVRRRLGSPPEVWCASGSGMLARCLGRAFPEAEICAVAVGLKSRWSEQAFPPNVRVLEAPLRFEQPDRRPAPFPSCPNYDRKAWHLAEAWAKPGALFWNVLG